MHTPDPLKTLHESPLHSALTKLPMSFDSVDDAADYMRGHRVDIQEIEPISIGGCIFSYAIITNRSFVYFGYSTTNVRKLVVGKMARTDNSPSLTEAERVADIKRSAHDSEQEEIALRILQLNPYASKYIKAINIPNPVLDEGLNFIITELIAPGLSLHEFLECYEGSTIEEKSDFAAAVGIQMMACIKELHENSLIHRDIKPDNVMLRHPDEMRGFIVMSDFNTVIDSVSIKTHIFEPTLNTSAPELLSKEPAWAKLRSPSCDYYSLGATLYYILLKKYPYQGATAEDILGKMEDNPEEPRRELESANVPLKLKLIILKLLQLYPVNRYRHAQFIINDLRKLVSGSAYEHDCGDVMLTDDDNIETLGSGIRVRSTHATATLNEPSVSTPAHGTQRSLDPANLIRPIGYADAFDDAFFDADDSARFQLDTSAVPAEIADRPTVQTAPPVPSKNKKEK